MAKGTITNKLIAAHLLEGDLHPGKEIALKIDQTLTQDATGTIVMLELEELELDRIKTELSAQYVDHNLVQSDNKNPDDHLFLRSAAQRFGLHFSGPGNGVSHPIHMARFGIPGKTMVGSDSHTCAAGAIGMLAIGTGGLDVALAMAGAPYYVKMPKVWGIRLEGELADWVSAKDVILEILRKHGVEGGIVKIIEYYGPGVKNLSAMDRHVIANMGAELGATTTVFPSDEITKEFFRENGRENEWVALKADDDCEYDLEETLNLSEIEPLIAKPSSPGNVVKVKDVAGEPIYQSYIGSSANPSYRDFAVTAEMLKERRIHPGVSFDVNPASREILENLAEENYIQILLRAGARFHQAGCNGCIGMGQAPASGKHSLRTTPRNFRGRSGTQEDSVWLCSPETATASAINAKITDPRDLGMDYPKIRYPKKWIVNDGMIEKPLSKEDSQKVTLLKGPNIKDLPSSNEFPDEVNAPIILKLGDDISTDEILPAGSNILPFRSNIEKIREFTFNYLEQDYFGRARESESSGHIIVAGKNYGQGSSREHAAIAPASLGLKMVLAKSFARIHWQNLISFGVLPLTFLDESDFIKIEEMKNLKVSGLRAFIEKGTEIELEYEGQKIVATHDLSERQREVLLAGGAIPWLKKKH
jgi:aconitate hydratase